MDVPPSHDGGRVTAATRSGRLAWWVGCALVVAAAAAFRLTLVLGDDGFSRDDPARVLKSDPALVYYITQQLAEGQSLVPPDFRADTRIEHPHAVDIPRQFTVFEEWLVAAVYRLLPGTPPLHMVALVTLSIVASCALLAIAGLAWIVTGCRRLALLAALLGALLPGNYRSLGALFLREDLALPLYALHLCAFAALVARPTPKRGMLFGLSLGLVLASWHLTAFVAPLEVLLLLAWCLVHPGAMRTSAWAALLGALVVAALPFPVLQRTLGQAWSLWVPLVAGLGWSWAAARRTRPASVAARGVLFVATLAACALLSRWASPEYGHVYQMILDRLAFLGSPNPPADPSLIDFTTRLLWQGPFQGATVIRIIGALFLAAALSPLLVAPVLRAWRERDEGPVALLGVLFLGFLLLGWLVQRLLVFAGLLAPVALVVLLRRLDLQRSRPAIAGLVVAHLAFFSSAFSGYWIDWYIPQHQDAIAETRTWVAGNLDPREPLCSDMVNGPTLLATCGNPMLTQPKYESAASRERIREHLDALFHGSPDDLRRYLRERETRFLLIDYQTLMRNFAYVAGLPPGQTPAGPSALGALLSEAFPGDGPPTPSGFTLRFRSGSDGGAWPILIFELTSPG